MTVYRMEDTVNNKIPWSIHCESILQKFYPSVIKNREEFTDWFMKREKIGWFFDKCLIVRLYVLWSEKINKENDVVIIIVGREGNGKSTLAMQIAAWMDLDFKNKNICLSREELEDEWISHYKSKAVITDEGGFMMFSRNAMMPENKEILQSFMLLRQFMMVNIINCPQYTSIDSKIRNERAHLLINVTARGDYQAYFGNALDKVNADLNKRKIKLQFIRVPMQHSWTGHFNQFMPRSINKEEYLKKKREHGNDFLIEMKLRREERERKMQKLKEKELNNGVLEPISQESELYGRANIPYLPKVSGASHLQLINGALNGTGTKQ